jgi:hypothetical protein
MCRMYDYIGSKNLIFETIRCIIYLFIKYFTSYYLFLNVDEPNRACKNKNFIAIVTFLAVVARSRINNEINGHSLGRLEYFLFRMKN